MPELQLEEAATADDLAGEVLPSSQGAACEACGAPVDPDDRFCNACGAEISHGPSPADASALPPSRHLRCDSCGAEITTDVDQRSYVCPFCDSNYVADLVADLSTRAPPEFVIGFAVTRDQALAKFRNWIRENNWFRPSDLRSAQIEGKLKGVYLPFWTFSMLAESKWSASIGEYWYRTETYTTTVNGKTVTRTRTVRETEWWDLSGKHHRYYNGFLVSGSRGLPQEQANRVKPFHLPALKRYEPYFLAGWLSEEYSIDKQNALLACQEEFRRQEQENISAFLPGDTSSGLTATTNFSRINSDLVLLPVYLLTYRYKDKLYRFLVNGQTGKVAGDKPLSGWRIALAVTAGAILLAMLVLIAFLST